MFNIIIWNFILAVHIVSFVTWIGGNIFICIALFSSLKLLDKTSRSSVLLQSLKRYFIGVFHALITLFITGALLIYHIGPHAFESKGIIGMAVLAILIALIFIKTYLGPFKKASRSIRPQDETFLSIRKQFLIIVLLGIIAIFSAVMG